MISRHRILGLGAIAIGLGLSFAPAASASHYQSTTGKTNLWLNEIITSTRPERTGRYNTQVQGNPWGGEIKVTQTRFEGGQPIYTGTFKDQPAGENRAGTECTGTVTLRRSDGRSGLQMAATWNVTGGKNCPAIGQTIRMTLNEPLPRPDARGDYSDKALWQLWRVVSADGELNCREQPTTNSKIVRVLKEGKDSIFLDGRLGYTISRKNGDAWMYVPYTGAPYVEHQFKPCYVRANSRFIQPVSGPF